MTEEKEIAIYDALQGITYSEWVKLSTKINRYFELKNSEQKQKLSIAVDEIKSFSLLI